MDLTRSPYLTYIQKSVAMQIKEIRKELGVSKTDFGKMIGTSKSQIDRLENPKQCRVSIPTLARIGRLVKRNVKIEFVKK